MKLTEKQIEFLGQWEYNFHCAVNAGWSPYPGAGNLRRIYDIYTGATGDCRPFRESCNHCMTQLMKDCGRLYFADKAELIARRNDARAVELSLKEAKPVKKVNVKTKK